MCAMYGVDGKVEEEEHGLSGARRGSVVASRIEGMGGLGGAAVGGGGFGGVMDWRLCGVGERSHAGGRFTHSKNTRRFGYVLMRAWG